MMIEMAPMEGITNYIYRQVFAAHFGGVDRYYTPFLSPNQTESLQSKEWKELDPENNAGLHVIPQLLTKNADHFLWAAGQAAKLGYREVNYNIGCPSGTVVAKGKGSGMLRDPDQLDETLDMIFRSCPIAVSIKTRIGISDPAEFEKILAIYNQYPIVRLIIHPRVQKEFYKGSVHREIFALACEQAKMPLVFNGNLATVSDVDSVMEDFPHLKGVMLGRGMLTNPALAEQAIRVPGASLTMDRFASFHSDLIRQNSEVLYGDHQVLHRMKEFWPYWYVNFTNGRKYWKAVRKARYLSDYLAAVDQLFSSEEIIPGAAFEAYSIR
ncbi:MAG: tRNA-dihydrouridine synthase family protein [Firmicutes bacterium]|nr:tRNA-dihydrouridine synthase family protein [Bacillota bacterium]